MPSKWNLEELTDAGAVWALVRKTLAQKRVPLPDDEAPV